MKLTALVGGGEAVSPFVAIKTYHRQQAGSWKLASLVYTHIIPDIHTLRFLSEYLADTGNRQGTRRHPPG